MGSFCSKVSAVDHSRSVIRLNACCYKDDGTVTSPYKLKSNGDLEALPVDALEKRSLEQSFSFSEGMTPNIGRIRNGTLSPRHHVLSRVLSEKSWSTKSKATIVGKSGSRKVAEVGLLLGRAGSAGFGKAVEVLDTISSSMTSMNTNNGFSSGLTIKGNKISILAFEVANTIVKGSTLLHSLSEENVKNLKELVLPSQAVQNLVSNDMDELLRIAGAEKRKELNVFCGEVVRFGNRCKDPQWHNLDRYFEKLGSEFTSQQQKEHAADVMQQLMILVRYTAELYHELHALDRFDQDYRQKYQEVENSDLIQKGGSLQILRQELKSQEKHARILKKKSLWSRNLEEVIEKLVDMAHFIHFEIHEAFGNSSNSSSIYGSHNGHQTLGPAGLALHYANIINQIDTIVSRSGSVPPSTRDALYQNLPPAIKFTLRWRLLEFQLNEKLQMTAPQIKAEMEKTLQWLVPMANNTRKAHHGFGWVGEWACIGTELEHKPAGHASPIRIETLYYADKEKTESYILNLIVCLHHFITLLRPGKNFALARSPVKSPVGFPPQKISVKSSQTTSSSSLTVEEQEMLRGLKVHEVSPGISKSQEFQIGRQRLTKHHRLSKSSNNSPKVDDEHEPSKVSLFSIVDFNADRNKALDVMDRLDRMC